MERKLRLCEMSYGRGLSIVDDNPTGVGTEMLNEKPEEFSQRFENHNKLFSKESWINLM